MGVNINEDLKLKGNERIVAENTGDVIKGNMGLDTCFAQGFKNLINMVSKCVIYAFELLLFKSACLLTC